MAQLNRVHKRKEALIVYQVSISKIFRPRRKCNRFHYPIEYWDSEAIQQRQASVTKKDIDPANVQVRPMYEEDVDAIAVIDSMYCGAPRPEYYREKLGSATKGAGISTSLVAEARTSIAPVDYKE
jgi:hypothetical protein